MLLQRLRLARRSLNALSSMSYSHGPAIPGFAPDFASLNEMEAYLAPVARRIGMYRLDLETNPAVLDKLASEGKISQHTADYFKAEIAQRAKGLATANKLHAQYMYFGLPLIIILILNAYYLEEEESAHLAKEGIEFVPYHYMGAIQKKFPWGDGYHTLFFNPERNFDPKSRME